MKKNILIFLFVLCLLPSLLLPQTVPVTGRFWTYQSFSLMFSRSFGLSIIPGTRYEFYRNTGANQGFYFHEFFVGPVFLFKKGALSFMLPVWYYYLGFPMEQQNLYVNNHNIALAPSVLWRKNKGVLSNRLFFHNTFYADIYKRYFHLKEKDQWGFSMLVTWKIEYYYYLWSGIACSLGNELYYGLVENKNVKPLTGPGFSESGPVMNRTYLGFSFLINDHITLVPDYVFEISKTGGKRSLGHYLYLTVKYTFLLYPVEKEPRMP